jgi:DNA-binding NarL/FixJ family response regulator
VTSTDVRNAWSPYWLVALFAGMATLLSIDVATDLRGGATVTHMLLELVIITTGAAAAVTIALRLQRSARDAQALRAYASRLAVDLDASEQQAERWRRDARDLISGLSSAIDAQFASWHLSPAECEIALLLLKGLSHKEIAEIRVVSETTVRQQARALYRKAGLGGRNELSAFFLEDLLGPRQT